MDVLHNMARILFEKETIHTDEVNMLMAGKSVEEVIAFMDKREAESEPKLPEEKHQTFDELEQEQKAQEQADVQKEQPKSDDKPDDGNSDK